MKSLLLASLVSLLLPAITRAADDFNDIANIIIRLINGNGGPGLIHVLIGAGLVVFIYGLVGYVVADSDEKKQGARQVITYGVVTLFVMVSVWGLVSMVKLSLTINNPGSIPKQTESIDNFVRD